MHPLFGADNSAGGKLWTTALPWEREETMRTLWLLAMGGLLVFGMTTAQAYPTLVGPTGTAVLPTAEVAGGFDIAGAWYDTEGDQTIPVRAVFALGENLEIGGLWAFNDLSDVWGVNAKLAFPLIANGTTAIGGQPPGSTGRGY